MHLFFFFFFIYLASPPRPVFQAVSTTNKRHLHSSSSRHNHHHQQPEILTRSQQELIKYVYDSKFFFFFFLSHNYSLLVPSFRLSLPVTKTNVFKIYLRHNKYRSLNIDMLLGLANKMEHTRFRPSPRPLLTSKQTR